MFPSCRAGNRALPKALVSMLRRSQRRLKGIRRPRGVNFDRTRGFPAKSQRSWSPLPGGLTRLALGRTDPTVNPHKGRTHMNSFLNPKRLVLAGVVAGSLATGVVLGATTISSTFAASTPTASSSASTSTGGGPSSAPAMPAHGSQAHESAEAAVTGADATKAQAAAVKAAGGGTAGAVTSDFTKSGYEVTVTKSDGSTVEIHLDSSFNVEQGHGGGPDNDAAGGPPANG